jgi:isopenicillin-N epimerase
MIRRRTLFQTGLVVAASAGIARPLRAAFDRAALPALPAKPAAALAGDEAYWGAIRRLYTVNPDIINLENGYYGIMTDPVRAAYHANIDFLNENSSVYMRGDAFAQRWEQVRVELARVLGVSPREIAVTRGATEALQNLIVNYNKLKPGDTVMYADLDYDSMQYAMEFLKERRGVEVVKIDLPEPASYQGVIDAYAAALARNRRTKLLLLTHVSHRTGLVVPVREVTEMARLAGADVILDAAHSWGQLDFDFAATGVDFAGFNLHKWIGAPLGVGFLYIKADRLADIDRQIADGDNEPTDIRSRVHTGTTNTANLLTVPDALAVHEAIGVAAKAARLKSLRDRWVHPLREVKTLQILTPDDPRMYGALTSFRLTGKGTRQDNVALAALLRDKYRIMTVRRAGVAAGNCVRVTPSLYNTEDDMDRLTAALTEIAAG